MSDPGKEQFEKWAAWFKCLSDPTRLMILHHVAGLTEATTVGSIVETLALTQSNVSHHLGLLANQRFIQLDPDGTRTLVSLNPLCMTELPDATVAIMGRDLDNEHAAGSLDTA